jgi:hypothetical protein
MRRRYLSLRGLLGLLAPAFALSSFAENSLPQTSPFLPAGGTTTVVAMQPETLEFAGVSVVAKQTLISLYDIREKKGRWIAVGTKSEGIEVVSYDGAHDQVVVRQGGQLKTLTLRKPGKVTGTPASQVAGGYVTPAPLVAPTTGAAPVAPNPNLPKKPLTVAQQEEEARMFVADMLDIGMQNRKAYEEAQKKAAAEKAAGKTAAPATPSGG